MSSKVDFLPAGLPQFVVSKMHVVVSEMYVVGNVYLVEWELGTPFVESAL